jgi:cytochrome c biogenesis protein CcdA
MFRIILYSAFAFEAALNLVYLTVQGLGTAYDQYNIASVVASYLTLIIMGWHLKALESDWLGLWPADISPESRRYVRIGMRVLGVPVLLGLVMLPFLDSYHLASRLQLRAWANHLLYLFYVGVNVNFLLLCLFGDWVLFSAAAKARFVSRSGRISKKTSQIREQIATIKSAEHSAAKSTKQIKKH